VTNFSISTAASVAAARELLRTATPPNQSSTQLSNFSLEKIDRALRLGFRRPAWVWFAADENNVVLGVVGGWGSAARTSADILDFLDLPSDPGVAHALLERAVADSTEEGRRRIEVIHFLPTESALDEPELAGLIATLAAAGFRLLVRRHRYRLPVRQVPVTIPDTALSFAPITDGRDPRLLQVMREILVGSLDAHDVAALAKGDLDTVAAETVTEFLGYDPDDSFFLASDPSGAVVGLVVGGLRGTPDTGVASFIGVSNLHRGHGYAAQLLGWITSRAISQNAEFIIGETDDDNFPMAAAFEKVGYPQTESRIDFVRDL